LILAMRHGMGRQLFLENRCFFKDFELRVLGVECCSFVWKIR